jgi:hypothetical protein
VQVCKMSVGWCGSERAECDGTAKRVSKNCTERCTRMGGRTRLKRKERRQGAPGYIPLAARRGSLQQKTGQRGAARQDDGHGQTRSPPPRRRACERMRRRAVPLRGVSLESALADRDRGSEQGLPFSDRDWCTLVGPRRLSQWPSTASWAKTPFRSASQGPLPIEGEDYRDDQHRRPWVASTRRSLQPWSLAPRWRSRARLWLAHATTRLAAVQRSRV